MCFSICSDPTPDCTKNKTHFERDIAGGPKKNVEQRGQPQVGPVRRGRIGITQLNAIDFSMIGCDDLNADRGFDRREASWSRQIRAARHGN
jgi:hypothetical protein